MSSVSTQEVPLSPEETAFAHETHLALRAVGLKFYTHPEATPAGFVAALSYFLAELIHNLSTISEIAPVSLINAISLNTADILKRGPNEHRPLHPH